MAVISCWLAVGLLLFWSLSVLVLADFQDSRYYVHFIYHEKHSLLLVIQEDRQQCYFAHVDQPTLNALNNCHRTFLENQVLHTIEWGTNVVKPSTLHDMRVTYDDLLADYRCTDYDIYTLDVTFGEEYVMQCTTATGGSSFLGK